MTAPYPLSPKELAQFRWQLNELQEWAESQAHRPSAKVGLLADCVGNPDVGRTYLVPSVFAIWNGDKKWWPVMGRQHSDSRFFGFEAQHYHVDMRFLPRLKIQCTALFECDETDPQKAFRKGVMLLSASPLQVNSELNQVGLHTPVPRRAKCQSAVVDMAAYRDFSAKAQAEMAATLPPAKRGDDGHFICPHQGFSLKQISPDEQGQLVCPLHGLKICAKSGALS